MSSTLADGAPLTEHANGDGTQTASYTLPLTGVFVVESVVAEVDASGSGDVTPTVAIADKSGQVIARKRQGEKIDGGTAAGSATWALRLDDEQAASGGDVQLLWEYTVPAGGQASVDTLTDGSRAGVLSQLFETLEVFSLGALQHTATGRYNSFVRFNGDNGFHYPSLTQELAGNPPAFNNSTITNSGIVYAAADDSGARQSASMTMWLPGYSSARLQKSGHLVAHGILSSSTFPPDEIVQTIGFRWMPAVIAGIDRLQFFPFGPGGTPEFAEGAYFAVYGRR